MAISCGSICRSLVFPLCSSQRPRACALEAFLPLQPNWSSSPNFHSGHSPAVLKGVSGSSGRTLSWESGDLSSSCLSPRWSSFLRLPLQSVPPKSTDLLQSSSSSNLTVAPRHLVRMKYKLCSLTRRHNLSSYCWLFFSSHV